MPLCSAKNVDFMPNKIFIEKDTRLFLGQRFGKLTITGRHEIKRFKRQSNTVFEVKCDCGRTKWVMKANLLKSFTKSCGCLKHSQTKYHKYHGLMFTIKQLTKLTNLSYEGLRMRIYRNKSLDLPKHYHHKNPKDLNSMAELGRQLGLSREYIRQLMKIKGLTKEQILIRYEKNK